MSQSGTHTATHSDSDKPTLLQVLSNPLILCHTTPYLPVADTLSLAATSKTFRYLIYQTPQVFRYLDLSGTKSAQFDLEGIDHGGETWRNVQLDENLTEDDFYSGPLRGIFSTLRRINILSNVQVLVLDGLSVTADLVHEIVTDPYYSVQILSLRECTHLNERKLRGTLKYICRPSRPEGTPRLKALYFFTKKEPSASKGSQIPAAAGVTLDLSSGSAVALTWNARSQEALAPTTLVSDEAEPEPWYGLRGPQSRGFRPIDRDWAQTLVDCDGIIAFDAVLCACPRHMNSPAWGKVDIAALEAASSSAVASVPTWAFAQYSLDGCFSCGSAPEGWTVWGIDDASDGSKADSAGRRHSEVDGKDPDIGRYPLLSPLPSTRLVSGSPCVQLVRLHTADNPQQPLRLPNLYRGVSLVYGTGIARLATNGGANLVMLGHTPKAHQLLMRRVYCKGRKRIASPKAAGNVVQIAVTV